MKLKKNIDFFSDCITISSVKHDRAINVSGTTYTAQFINEQLFLQCGHTFFQRLPFCCVQTPNTATCLDTPIIIKECEKLTLVVDILFIHAARVVCIMAKMSNTWFTVITTRPPSLGKSIYLTCYIKYDNVKKEDNLLINGKLLRF